MRRVIFAVALLLYGCGPDVESLCERLEEECPSISFPYEIHEQTCVEEGEQLQDRADARNCSAQFDALLDCVDARGCHWNTDCVAERQQVLSCLGE
jgi:hypothetical protein